ncbi:bifunctional diguanylate cyclase/phosphodiesterase [Legionella spiritensis]|uniref:Regulatory protein (GGDEF and EAL domains) n=1 Tax=Legionella spiritensis TaxID=452 RepID=A0A0W0Z925_LEGSP|nr:bifunctional diguanylate cyclase/phosphodiesterase [Legionella spiritensis]KTD65535.1 regulatory protein (GGDEF and EAL domains) [Legionella spiritensis]SNV44620.1 regulatory protein (GGDEF and EAL domains) [Legionella spiritensis]
MSFIKSELFKSHVNRYSMMGLGISISSIVLATLIVAYQISGNISIDSILLAQTTNPAIWALDLSPFIFAYWGQSFCYGLANKAESMLQDKTRELTSKKDNLEIKLKYESTHDRLTNLPNYHLFIERIKQAIGQLDSDSQAAVFVLNINDFKEINYGFGSFHANTFLVQFADKLKSILIKPSMLDAYMGMNVIARLRNDEFAVLLPRLSKNLDLDQLLDNISQETSVHFMIEGINMSITTTVGAAIYPTHGLTPETLMTHATDSIYFAKKEGKPYAIYHSGIQDKTTINRAMLDAFEQSIDNDKAFLQFQPHVELRSGKIIGVEASVKLENTDMEVLNEEKLFQLMDDARYARKLVFFTLKNLIKQIAAWHDKGNKIYGEMDLSIADLGDPELVPLIQESLVNSKLPPQYLKISLTEKACLSDQAKTLTALNNIAALGVQIAIKDFSTGYTSFVYLINFPVHEIKIDGSFISKMVRDEKYVHIVQAIIQIASALKLQVMARGIPDQATTDQLIKLGCMYGQGTFFGTRILSREMTEILEKKSE